MQLEFDFITPPPPEPAPAPPVFQKGEGWYQVALFHYPTKESLDKGKAEQEDTMIYAKTLLSAKIQSRKWEQGIRKERAIKYPIDETWEEVPNSNNRYGKHWEKHGNYYSCNPKLFLIPNNLVE